MVGIEDSKRMLESLPNKIHDKLGIVASINIYNANGAENVRYGNRIPKSISEKLINQYACGKLNSESIYKSLVVIEKENKIWEKADGTREYISVCYFV